MKTKNRQIVLLVFLLSLFMGAVQVHADVLFEPLDLFYARNREDCDYHGRSYIANGPKGNATVYFSPEDPIGKGKIANGENVWIDYVYTDKNGTEWGYTEDENAVGWVPISYLFLRYDYISFRKDYGTQIQEEHRKLDSSYNGQMVYFWRYPGSDSGHEVEIDTEHLECNSIFVDEEGRTWGFVGYYYGRENSWICLDDPTADFNELYPDGAPVRDTSVMEEYTGRRIIPRIGLLFGVGVAVVVTMIATVILLIYMKRTKKKSKLSEKEDIK